MFTSTEENQGSLCVYGRCNIRNSLNKFKKLIDKLENKTKKTKDKYGGQT